MDFGKAFTYIFEDPDWIKKVLLAAVFSLIPIVGSFVSLGWSMEAGQRVIRQDPQALPEVDFGKHLGFGFKIFLIFLVYSLPLIILYVPIVVLATMAGQSDTIDTAITIAGLCCGGLMLLYSILLLVILPAAVGNFLATDQVAAGFRFGEIFGLLRAAPGAYLITLLGGLAAGFIASLGSIACFIGVLATAAYASAVMGNLYGQAYRAAIANGAQVS